MFTLQVSDGRCYWYQITDWLDLHWKWFLSHGPFINPHSNVYRDLRFHLIADAFCDR